MVENNLGRNITFPIYYDTVVNGTATQHETGLVIHKATVETSVMSLGDKITGDVYYANNSLQVTMQEYIVYNNVRYILVNPPTIIREGMVVDNGNLRGMTKYSFEFYHPMYVLGNFPFSDVAVSQDEKRYLSENKSFSWIGKPQDFIDKINKNLEGTEWIVVKSENFPADTENELSDVLTFDNNTIADALKTGYETWGLPYIVDQIREDEDEQAYNNGKRFKVIFGLPSNVIKNGRDEYVFRMGQGVGLKNNSRTPRNNKIVTRIAGYGSENNIPYGYPQIQWYGESNAKFTYGDHAGVYDNVTIGGRTFEKFVSYPIYDGIVGGQNVKLIKHPFTRNHLMPSVYRRELFNKVSPYLSGGSINSYYNPDIELVDYYDANTDSYPNQINLSSPSYEIHQFEDIKPELGEAKIVGVQPINNDGTDADGWDDTMDDDGNYLQSYFKLTLPQLDFDLYACAAITEEMQINMRGGACIGCTFPVQVDWDDYKKNFYDDQGNFAPNGAQRNLTKYPKSNSGRITLILQKDNNTFGTLMPNIYQQPKGETSFGEDDGDEFVILGISLPDTYVTNAEGRLASEMQAYMLANNIYYYDYPLKFDEYFLATHTNILSQIRTNTQVKFQFADEDPMTLFVKQIVIKYGDNVLPQYDITLTDSVEVVLNQIGQVVDSVEKLSTLVSVLRQSYNRNVWGEIAKKLSKTSNDTAQGEITFVQGLKIGSNGNNGITPNGDATLNDVNVSGDLTITHVETPQGGEPIVKEYGITNDGDISGEGLTLGDYSDGLLGTGGVFKMINGKSYLEADRLYVRMKAYFDTLEIRRYIHSGGNRVASAAGMKCSRVEWYSNDTAQGTPLDQTNPDNKALVKRFKCYFNKTDGNRTITNDFVIADLAYCKTTNLAGSNQNAELNQKYYWRRVKGVGTTDKEHYIVLSNTDNEFDGTDFPEAEDDIVQLGNGNSNAHADRQGAIIEAVSQSGACAPTYRIYQGINSFNLENKCKVDMGYDLTTHRAYLNVFGDFYVGDENENTYVKYEQAHNFGTNANPVYNPLLSIKARIEAASTIGNTSIDQYVGTATQTLIDGKNAVYTITGVAMTQSGPDYKAGDIWILPNTIGNYPAGTILVANSDRTIDGVNSHNINKWDKKDSYTDDSAFNGYISRLTAGTLINNPSDAQAITNILNVLKGSLESQTTIDGGLVLTSLIAMRNSDDNVTAGLCGDDQDNEIAAWFGGIQKDYEKLTDAQKSQGWSVQKWAKSLFRFDGSGYLAGGNISWENDGDTTVQGTIKADNFFHAVCHYLEYGLSGIYYGSVLYYYKRESGHDETYDGFVNGKYYTAEQIYSRFRSIPSGFIITTGKADIVMCAPDPNNNWATIDDQLPYVTIPKPEDFQGKVIEVGGFCYSTGASGEPTVKTFEVHCVCGDLNPRDTRMTLLVWLNDNQNGLTTTSLSNKVTISTGGVARFLSVQLADLRWVWVLLANQTGGSVVINGGGGSGTSGVTSVGMTVPAGFSVSPQTITDTGSFDIIFARGNLSNGLVLATPSSGNNAPSWRALVASDIPNLDWSKITSGTPTNLSGYGITDAKIENGVITLGGSSIIPLTSQSLNGYATERYVQNNCMMTSERGNYVKIDGDTVTGALTVNDNITIGSGKKLLFGTSAKIYFDDDTIAIDMKDEDNYDVTNYVYHTGNFNPSDYTNVVTAIQVNGQTLAPVSASYPTTFNIDLTEYFTRTTNQTVSGYKTFSNGLASGGNISMNALTEITFDVDSAVGINSNDVLYLHGNNGILLSDDTTVNGIVAINGSNSATFALDVAGVIRANTGIRIGASRNDALTMDTSSVAYIKMIQSGGETIAISSTLATFGWDNSSVSAQYGYLNFNHRPKVGGVNVALTSDIPSSSSFVTIGDVQTITGAKTFSGNTTMVGNWLYFKRTTDGSAVGEMFATNVRPQGSQGYVDCLRIAGTVDFDNDGAPPMVNGNYLATQDWVDGRYLPLTGGSLSNDLTIASNKYLRFGSNSGGLLIHNTTNGNNSLDISANRINLNAENGLFYNGVEVSTHSAIQNEFVAKAGSSMTGALSMSNGINVNFGYCAVSSNASAEGIVQAGMILKLMGNYVAVTAGDNADANFTVNGNIVATRPWVTTQLGGYLPLTAGSSHPLTGNIAYKGTKATKEMIAFIDNKSDQWGNGIAIGGGGMTVIGGGESAANMVSGWLESDQAHYGGDEVMFVANDADVSIFTNATSWANKKEFLFNKDGSLSLPLAAGDRKLLINSVSGLIYNAPTSGGWASSLCARDNAGTTNLGAWGFFGGQSSGTQTLAYLYAGLSWDNTWMVILPNGNLGIGTTSPAAKLDVVGNIGAKHTSGEVLALDSTASYTCAQYKVGGTSKWSVGADSSKFYFYSNNGSSIRMSILEGGNVGIGTTSPQAKLDVNGSVKIAGSLTGVTTISTSSGIFAGGSIETKGSFVWCDSQNFSLTIMEGLAVSGDMNYCCALFRHKPQVQLGTDMLEVVVAKSDENGIEFRGSEDGTYTFGYGSGRGDIYAGAGDFTGKLTVGNRPSDADQKLYVGGSAVITGNVGIGTRPTGNYAVEVDGSVYASSSVHASSFVNNSDIRMKDVIRYIEPSVHDIAIAPIIEFAWKKGDGSKNIGSIAQYWQTVFPQAVHESDDGILSMEYGNIALASAITAARKAVDNERRIAELELRVAELESLISG